MKQEELIQKGSEADIILKNNKIVKRRVHKTYRINQIDEKLRKLRTRSESKLMEKASKIINTPKIIDVDENKKEIYMDFIKGKSISEKLNDLELKKQKQIFKIIGENISKLHNSDIIHGDLTTSNMILEDLNKKKIKIFFIDFGLGFISHKIEDKAVDLRLLKQAIEAKHFQNWKLLFKEVLKGYVKDENSEKVLSQLKKVESRGRYKDKG